MSDYFNAPVIISGKKNSTVILYMGTKPKNAHAFEHQYQRSSFLKQLDTDPQTNNSDKNVSVANVIKFI